MRYHIQSLFFTLVLLLYCNALLGINLSAVDFKSIFGHEKNYTLNYSGFIKADTFYDTRQAITQAVGDDGGVLVLFPTPKKLDPVGRDIHHHGDYNKLIVQTRIRYEINGPNVDDDIETQAFIEGDFYGVPPVIRDYRIRHAFIKLSAHKYRVLAGHYWHPMYVVECAPDQLAADSGNPLALESRAPQIRCIINLYKKLDLSLSLASQFGYISNGPDGFSTVYARNSMTPNFTARLQVLSDKNIIGAILDFKRLRPRLVSDKGFKVNEIFSSVAATFFATKEWNENFLTKLCIHASQNLTNMYQISGYAVASINPVTDERKYANLSAISGWGELIYTTKLFEPGIFIGATKNLGAGRTIIPTIPGPDGTEISTIYALEPNLASVVRIAPRIRLFLGPLTLAGEAGWTRAGYGTILPDGTVNPNEPTWLLRMFATVYYFF